MTPAACTSSLLYAHAGCWYVHVHAPMKMRKLSVVATTRVVDPQVTGVAVHLRRGDVTPIAGHQRWIPEMTYLQVLREFDSRPIHVHSEGSPDAEEFGFCRLPECKLKLGIDVLEAFHDAICARHFIGSGQSLLSVSIALMRRQNSTLIFNHRGLLRTPPLRWRLVRNPPPVEMHEARW